MKERPVIFSGPMVKAILGGRKTQTRRVVKKKHITEAIISGVLNGTPPGFRACPYGEPGDRMWVRESWHLIEKPHLSGPYCVFPDGGQTYSWNDEYYPPLEKYAPGAMDLLPRKRPSIFMPRWASRITLEITNVKVERLHDT